MPINEHFTVKRHIQLLTGITSTLNASNYILLKGQPCYNLETKEFKIGDGTKTWSELESISGDGSGTILDTNVILNTGLKVLNINNGTINKYFDVEGDVTNIIKLADKVIIEGNKYDFKNVIYSGITNRTTITVNTNINIPNTYINTDVILEKTTENAIQTTYDLIGNDDTEDITNLINRINELEENVEVIKNIKVIKDELIGVNDA